MNTLQLPGLQGHHPLGFLAACGTLRICEIAGKLEPKLSWKQSDDNSGWIAVLHFKPELTLNSLVATLIRRARSQRTAPWLSWSTKVDDADKFRQAAERMIKATSNSAMRESLDFLSSLASDLVLDSKGKLSPTLLDLTSGNQRLLTSIREIAIELSQTTKRGIKANSPADAFMEALCGPWLYRDTAHSMGWDPKTQRLHALRNMLPSDDKANRSVKGAVFLASQALPLFPAFAVNGRIRTACFCSANGSDYFVWPIWKDPISLDVVRSLLLQQIRKGFAKAGVVATYSSQRVRTGGSKGDYQVLSNALGRALG